MARPSEDMGEQASTSAMTEETLRRIESHLGDGDLSGLPIVPARLRSTGEGDAGDGNTR